MIMSHTEWMKQTYGGPATSRSTKLKAIDSALQNYHSSPNPNNLQSLQGALSAWMQEKGADWRTSVRNKHNAIENLYRQVAGMEGATVDRHGKQALQREARQVVNTLFQGAEITWKTIFTRELQERKQTDLLWAPYEQYKISASNVKVGLAGNSTGLAINSVGVDTFRHTGNAAGPTAKAASKLIDSVVPASIKVEVLHALTTIIPSFHAQFAAAVMPMAGLLTAGGAAIWNAGGALVQQYSISQARTHAERSLAGLEAGQAIDAMIRILVRERNMSIFNMSTSLTEFGGKLAGLAIDGGVASTAAVGLAANIVKLMNIIRIIARDVQEKNAANSKMREGRVGISIFETCPLAGCYLVCCAPTSVLVSLILERFGEHGWMDTVERAKSRHVEPLQAQAREVIKSHRFEILRLRNFPGLLEINQGELDRMAASVGKTGMVGYGRASK